MDSSEKKCYRKIQLPGIFASSPGAREISFISGSLLDDQGGITCRYHSASTLVRRYFAGTGTPLIDDPNPQIYFLDQRV